MWASNSITALKTKNVLTLILLIFLLITMPQCTRIASSRSQLPHDILGIYIGMKKDDVSKHLNDIANFDRNERKNQQVWILKNDPRFSHVAVGYDKENNVRYVTAFVDAANAKERIRFSDVGDLSNAKSEITAPHYRYIWEVPPEHNKPAYFVSIYGDNPESLLYYSISKKIVPVEKQKAEEEEDEY